MTLDASQIAEQIRKGKPNSKAPYNKGMSAMSDEQAKAIADYIKTLK
jgi:mono/diheme cytochrome c family protein